MDEFRQLLRAFVETFPKLKLVLKLYDCYVYVIRFIFQSICSILRYIRNLIQTFILYVYSYIRRNLFKSDYERITKSGGGGGKRDEKKLIAQYNQPVPYNDNLFKRTLTYWGGLILGTSLYVFVYFVLIKHHTYTTISVAILLLLAYLVVLENSHNIRSIIMLCLPIMFTNRGRALVFCFMLTLMLIGPLKNTQSNINELHTSLNCCKYYLLLASDRGVNENLIKHAVRFEEAVIKLVESVKEFTRNLKERFEMLIKLAITVEHYIELSIEKLMKIVNICNTHTLDAYNNCKRTFEGAYEDCNYRLGSGFDVLCQIVRPLIGICNIVKLPDVLCEIPRSIVYFIDSTIGVRLRQYLAIIQNELYFDVNIDRVYYYNGTKSRTIKEVVDEVKFDVNSKFWYVHLFSGVFKLISLILVCWILITATLYHMHYLSDLHYDNIYIDGYLKEIDDRRRRHYEQNKSNSKEGEDERNEEISDDEDDDDDDDKGKLIESNKDDFNEQKTLLPNDLNGNFKSIDLQQVDLRKTFLFPMNDAQEREYFKPFSFFMNKTERHKLYISGFIWLAIISYIFLFVALDYSLFKLIQLVENILNDVLFKSDLPIIELTSKKGDNEVVVYNRTYLNYLRLQRNSDKIPLFANSTLSTSVNNINYQNSSIGSIYRRLMDSIEKNIPDDVAILDSLEQCLPKPLTPDYDRYTELVYLALFTFGAVVTEAYALRVRHCIANLYYPRRARQRAVWFYRRLLKEKPKFADIDRYVKEEENLKTRLLGVGLKMLTARAKRS